jgi:hypothetical protein
VCETQRDRTVILLRDHAVGIFQVKDTIYTTREMPASKFSRTVYIVPVLYMETTDSATLA